MNILTSFYDKLFLYYYNLKKNSDNTPEYFPIIIISFGEVLYIMFLLTLFFYFLKIDFSSLPKVFLVVITGTTIFNYYLYVIKGRKEIVLKKNLKLSLEFKVFSYIYILASLWAPLFLIYFINEVL